MNQRMFLMMKRATMLAFLVLVLAPVSSFAQRRWVTVRPQRSRVVIYQPRPYVIYQRQPTYRYRTYTYGYPQSYNNAYYSNGYGYTEPYYSSPYYSYRSSQPYFANRYTYSWANPTYRYSDNGYRARHRNNGVQVRIRLR
jgi:hypothetical protein